MDESFYKTILYDFYGELLPEAQRRIFELRYFDDCSLAEIAETAKITRQGARDSLKRAAERLFFYEEKLGRFRKYSGAKAAAEEASAEIDGLLAQINGGCLRAENRAREALHKIQEKILDIVNY
ncbi:MAG: DNA-binding protein [Clostridiales bacterium]|jgi:predicted DNA-binding protein YlxM (UPF0122 family)|nr:DNA-binding protein [Clostridiales bacterium]